jgi:hypothetical protein
MLATAGLLLGAIWLSPLLGKANRVAVLPVAAESYTFNIYLPLVMKPTDAFTFGSMGDAQANAPWFAITVNQLSTLHPDVVIFNGDLEQDGVVSTELDPMIAVLKNAGLYDQFFPVRGNHDDHVAGSAVLWENYFEAAPNIRSFPIGVKDYESLDSSSDTLDYSFIYLNSMFIGLDTPGTVKDLTPIQLAFLDSRLTYAESMGLVHAFIYFHGPMYCVESQHCSCSMRTDSSCTPPALITVINKHSVISAFFHGHEHILGWTHMDNTRLAGLTGNFEEFFTSPSGSSTYNSDLYPARMDYTYMGTETVFTTITVTGNSFMVNFYRTGTASLVWTKTFTKGVP